MTQTTCPSKYTRHEAFTAAANCSRPIVRGCQIGLVNYANRLDRGCQIGLINIISHNGWLPVLPIINGSL